MLGKNEWTEEKRFMQLSLLYSAFALFYFVRGPGWIRYLFGFQMISLILLMPSLRMLVARMKEKFFPQFPHEALFIFLGVIMLAGIQIYHLLYFSNVPRSKAALDTVFYVEERMKKDMRSTLGLVNVPEVAAFSDPMRTYHMVWLRRTMPPFGAVLFSDTKRPNLVITDGKNFLLGEAGEGVLQNEYIEIEKFGRYRVYKLSEL